MIELERHIEILLLSNDCVIVPDFGGFMAHHVDACYDEEEHLFLPPRRTLGFNQQLTLNDSLLVQSYIEAYDISYPEALRRIEDEVRELKQHIDHDGEYVFNDLGVITLNGEGKYSFEPCEAGILTPSLYGLNSFEITSLQEAITVPIESRYQHASKPLSAEPKAVISNAQSRYQQSSLFGDDEDEEPYTIRPSVVRNLVAACLAVLAFLVFPANIGNDGDGKSLISGIDTSLLTRVMPKESVQKPVAVKKIAARKDTASIAPAVKKDTVSAPQEPYYTVVLCSRVSQKNATAYATDLNRQGYTEARVMPKGKNSRVIYGHYPTENQAYNVMNHLTNRAKFKGCWVLRVKG